MKKIILIFLLTLTFSCSDEETDFTAQNEMDIKEYIQENNLTTQKTNSGIYYIINTDGSGNAPTVNSNVTIGYKGYFLDNSIFDQSMNATFNLSAVIPGFSQSVQLLKPGGSGTFIIPSRLAYGNKGSSSIPGGAVLVFDINLISIN
ncbi:FKBP-type peptidyl-prolyl cis-trans isomerase [Polaribacter sp.]|uniref:FKBP-type peptidyl-prolyl cis-trans isomerase n=1 Tax=Polaribacter sp. TaxID=1920175 RepID=UPI0025E49EFE|nr:FKBP-type peptidyl-prolyl cis-trans isomerase [Polaribacter sp.]